MISPAGAATGEGFSVWVGAGVAWVSLVTFFFCRDKKKNNNKRQNNN